MPALRHAEIPDALALHVRLPALPASWQIYSHPSTRASVAGLASSVNHGMPWHPSTLARLTAWVQSPAVSRTTTRLKFAVCLGLLVVAAGVVPF